MAPKDELGTFTLRYVDVIQVLSVLDKRRDRARLRRWVTRIPHARSARNFNEPRDKLIVDVVLKSQPGPRDACLTARREDS